MEIVAVAYTRQGGKLCAELIKALSDRGHVCKGYLFHKYENSSLAPFEDIEPIIEAAFAKQQALILICAVGIAVRKISSFVSSKLTDAPVIVIDDMGRFCIPVLSGHLGGANMLAEMCAEITDGIPVITTATDIHAKFAVDVFAKSNGLYITDMKKAKQVSADLLDGKKIYLYAENVHVINEPSDEAVMITDDIEKARLGGIIISVKIPENSSALQLIPKQITLGIGCRRGTGKEQIEAAVKQVLFENNIAFQAVRQICSIDLKRDEKGLIDFADENGLMFQTFGSDALLKVQGSFKSSEFVNSVTGVDNVCERSAIAGSNGRLVVGKTVREHVTVAAAVNEVDIQFVSD